MRFAAAIAIAMLHEAAIAAPLDRSAVDASVAAFMAKYDVGAVHVTVIDRGEVTFSKGYGNPAPDRTTIFPIGSISKHFNAALVNALADDGLVDLDAPAGRYLPEWFADEPAITVRRLLEQTSGLPDFLMLDGYRALADDPSAPPAAFLALADKGPRRFPPVARWAYSNTNYKALALIAERVTGEPFYTALEHKIFRPAGVSGIAACHSLKPERIVVGYRPDGSGAPLDASEGAYTGDGGLCANADALARWMQSGLAAGGRLRQLAEVLTTAGGTPVPYNNGLSTRPFLGKRMIWHGGNVDGHSTMIAHSVDDDRSMILLANKGYVWPTEVMPAVFGAPLPAIGRVGSPLPTGKFEDGLFDYELAMGDGVLHVDIDPIGPVDFLEAGPNDYVARDLPATFRLRFTGNMRDSFEIDWGEVRAFAYRVAD